LPGLVSQSLNDGTNPLNILDQLFMRILLLSSFSRNRVTNVEYKAAQVVTCASLAIRGGWIVGVPLDEDITGGLVCNETAPFFFFLNSRAQD
jgi:hypothetical protein